MGKTQASYFLWIALSGSPPRGWGKLLVLIDIRSSDRFTPTRVGKTSSGVCGQRRTSVHPHAGGENVMLPPLIIRNTVHPHAGGENCLSVIANGAQSGSPPRGWGKHLLAPSPCGSCAVHPHAGGENVAAFPFPLLMPGSPPRGWGKHSGFLSDRRRRRFTPTRVGKTLGQSPSTMGHTVHPHAGGENASIIPFLDCGIRFTPTRVGKTSASSSL